MKSDVTQKGKGSNVKAYTANVKAEPKKKTSAEIKPQISAEDAKFEADLQKAMAASKKSEVIVLDDSDDEDRKMPATVEGDTESHENDQMN